MSAGRLTRYATRWTGPRVGGLLSVNGPGHALSARPTRRPSPRLPRSVDRSHDPCRRSRALDARCGPPAARPPRGPARPRRQALGRRPGRALEHPRGPVREELPALSPPARALLLPAGPGLLGVRLVDA